MSRPNALCLLAMVTTACSADVVPAIPVFSVQPREAAPAATDFQPTRGLTETTAIERVSASLLFFGQDGELGAPYGWSLDGTDDGIMTSGRNGVEASWIVWALSKGHVTEFQINGRSVRSGYGITQVFVDADGRSWAAVHAKSTPGERRHGWEVYDRAGAFLFSVQRPLGETIYDASGDRIALLKARREGHRPREIIVRQLSAGERGETVLW